MSYLLPDCPSAIFLFSFVVPANSDEEGIKRAMPIVKQCEDFAEGLHIFVSCEYIYAFDGFFSTKVLFNIKESNDAILIKVSSLFAFAASIKLTLTNQFFYPE